MNPTTSTQSAIHISSSALVLLGHEPLTSFNEMSAGATLANQFYYSTYTSLITQHRWNFATKEKQLSRLTETPLNTQHKYKFALPADLTYLIKLDTGSLSYTIVGDDIYSNCESLIATYLFTPDERVLPPYFIKTLEFMLAMQLAIPLTGSETLAALYKGMFDAELRKAKFADSSQTPSDAMAGSNRYVAIRKY